MSKYGDMIREAAVERQKVKEMWQARTDGGPGSGRYPKGSHGNTQSVGENESKSSTRDKDTHYYTMTAPEEKPRMSKAAAKSAPLSESKKRELTGETSKRFHKGVSQLPGQERMQIARSYASEVMSQMPVGTKIKFKDSFGSATATKYKDKIWRQGGYNMEDKDIAEAMTMAKSGSIQIVYK